MGFQAVPVLDSHRKGAILDVYGVSVPAIPFRAPATAAPRVPASNREERNVYTVEAVEQRVIGVIADLTEDWDVDIEGGMTPTTMVGDVGFASIDFIQMAVAIESEFKTKLGFRDLLMQGGNYIDDVSVRQIAEFVAGRLNNGVPVAPTQPAMAAGTTRVTSIPEEQRVSPPASSPPSAASSRPATWATTARRRTSAPCSCCPRRVRVRRCCASCSPAISACSRRPNCTCCRTARWPTAGAPSPARTPTTCSEHRARADAGSTAGAPSSRWRSSPVRARNMTAAFYRELRAPLKGERPLVDKTPWYIVDVDILKRIERDFVDPLYIHLVRHPGMVVRSWPRNPRCSACCRSPRRKAAPAAAGSRLTLASRAAEPCMRSRGRAAGRWLQVRYEDLVVQPEAVLRRMCDFLGIAYEDAMVNPVRRHGPAHDRRRGDSVIVATSSSTCTTR